MENNSFFTSDFLLPASDFYNHHCDALGSPRKMTDENGAVVWAATYYPFGEMTAGSSNTHGFTGKEFDAEMGINYFCQRYYDPEIGRFMTLDPFAGYIELPQSQNRYAYCMANPLKYIDPLGLYSSSIPPGGVWTDYIYIYGYGEMPGASASIYPGHHRWYWHWNRGLLGGGEGDLGPDYGPLPGSYGYDSRRKRGGRPQKGGSGSGGSSAPADALTVPKPEFKPPLSDIKLPSQQLGLQIVNDPRLWSGKFYIDKAAYNRLYWGWFGMNSPQIIIEGLVFTYGPPIALGKIGVPIGIGFGLSLAMSCHLCADKFAKENAIVYPWDLSIIGH